MIRHRPMGRGHPYLVDPEQRLPVWPIAGEPFAVGATTPTGTRRLCVEFEGSGRSGKIEAISIVSDATPDKGGSHLSAAATASAVRHGRMAWQAVLPGMARGGPVRYRFVSNGSSTRWYPAPQFEWRPDGGRLDLIAQADAATRLVAGTESWLIGSTGSARLRFDLLLEPNEHVVGFGERFNALDQRGRRLDAQVFEQYKGQGDRTYLPMPFAIVVGGIGWGFHVATGRRTWFDVGASSPDRLRVEVDLDPEEKRPSVTLHLYQGDPPSVLGQFLSQVGRPSLPPAWIFDLWMSGNEWNSQVRVMEEVSRTRSERIAAGVVVIEAWSDEATFTAFRDAQYEPRSDRPHRLGDFSFPVDGAWPDPKGMVDELHRLGLKVLLWQIPLLKQMRNAPTQLRLDRDVMLSRGYNVKLADGRPYHNRGWWFPRALMPDFTSESARQWWTDKRRYLVEELGIDGFKTDGGEHAWGEDLRYADGSRGGAGNNRFPVAYAAAFHQLLREAAHHGVTFSRAGFTGAQSFPCHWAGDEDSTWEAYRAAITAGVTAGACGVYFWGWDLAGFSGEIPSAELYLRAAGMACFCPIMQYHSEFNGHRSPSRDRTPWNIAERTGDTRVLPVFRSLAELRQRLKPYLHSQARGSLETNRPLMRALMFDHPADPAIWDWPLQYLLGDDLLVAPVVEPGVETWTTYLPAGKWTHLWTEEELTGPDVVNMPAPVDHVPVFVRQGAASSLIPALLPDAGRRRGR